MGNGDFFSDSFDDAAGRESYDEALAKFKDACEEGIEATMLFTEDEFLYIIEHYMSKDNEVMVLKTSELAFEQHSYSVDLLVRLVDSLLMCGNIPRALYMLEQYKDSFPNNRDIVFLYARAYINQGEYEKAKRGIEDMLSESDDIADYADSFASLGQDCIDAGNFEAALDYFLQADKLVKDPVEFSNDIAFCYERLDQLDKAELYYNLFLDKDPFNDNVWFNIGTVYAKKMMFDEAIEAFEYSLALNGGNSSSLYNLAVVFLNLERFAESVDCFNQFNELEPDNIPGLIGLANAQMGLREFKGAYDTFCNAYDIDPQCDEALLGLSSVMAIRDYLNGDKGGFFLRLNEIVKKDSSWVGTIYKILPQLGSDGEFIAFMESVKKS